mgnify:CR=1 FL=1
MARPTKYTPQTVARLLDGIRLGLTYRLAAAYAGIDYATFCRWRMRYASFATQLQEAEAHAAAVVMARIHHAAASDWRAAAWMLERRYPEDFGPRQRLEQAVTVDVRQAAERVAAELSVPVDVVLAEASRMATGEDG